MSTQKELIKVWHEDGFNLRLYYTGKVIEGKDILSYRFSDSKRGVVFSGDDFGPSPLHAIDSMHTVYSLLGFLSLRLGDTDRDYFDTYTPDQFAWMESSRCEELQNIVDERSLA